MNCWYCNKTPDRERNQYRPRIISADDYVRLCYSSYNKRLDTFCCDQCYDELGRPAVFTSDPRRAGWKAGEPLSEHELQRSYRQY